jgi:hypothetical protein
MIEEKSFTERLVCDKEDRRIVIVHGGVVVVRGEILPVSVKVVIYLMFRLRRQGIEAG